jgi:5-enolpyruvylshikimate-3-phosphate synthase
MCFLLDNLDAGRMKASRYPSPDCFAESGDSRELVEPSQITPAAIETYHDHRMAMAFAVTGLKVPGIVIKDPDCTAKTFPDYFTRFFQLLGLNPACI